MSIAHINCPGNPGIDADFPRHLAAADAALLAAVEKNDLPEVCRRLDAGGNINVHGVRGATPVMLAALYGHEKLLNELVRRGADMTARDDSGVSVDQYIDAFGSYSEASRDVVRTLVNRAKLRGTMAHQAGHPGQPPADSTTAAEDR